MEPWDPENSNWAPPEIILILFVKQILTIKRWDIYVENVGFWIEKIKFRNVFFSFLCKSGLTLSPIHIFVAFFTYSEEVVAY